MTVEHLPVAMVALALLGAYAAPLVGGGRRNIAPWLAIAITSTCLAGSIVLARVVASGPIHYLLGGWAVPWGIEVVVDGPAVFMMITITTVTLAAQVYAAKGLELETAPAARRWFWALNLLLVASMMGISMARDLFNLFVFVEIASLAACGIVTVKGDGPALESTLRYLVLSALGTGALLFGTALIYMATGHLNMGYVLAAMPAAVADYPGNIYAGLGFLTLGFCVKAALFPLHTWLPDAHSSAPAPSSAILSGLVVKAFAFAYWRVLTVALAPALVQVPVGQIIVVLGTVATLAGSVLAAGQFNLKRLLAYSTVAQVGYIFIGFGLGGTMAVRGAMIYILAHGLMKAGLFLAAGCMLHAAGVRRIGDMAGLGRSMPVTLAAFTALCVSMVGIPPLAGFAGKWYLVMGALDQGQPLVATIMVLSSALTAFYLMPPVIRAYFAPGDGTPRVRVPVLMQAPVVALAGLVILTGIFPAIMIGLLGM